MNLVRHIIEHEIIGVSGGGGGGTTIKFYDEGVYKGAFGEVDIVGTNHNAEPIAPGRIAIYSPSMAVSPYYNTGGATVPNIATSNRNVAAPTTEGSPYKIGDWIAGTVHPCFNSSSISYNTPVQCRFESATTTVEANLYDADGIVAQHITAPIGGNIDVTLNGIRIQITGWAAEGIKYKANIYVTYNLATIIPQGGRISIQIVHHNNGADYQKTQNDIFYDPNPLSATVNTPIISENTPAIKYLSGVPYYNLGSTFNVSLSDVDYVNSNSYIAGTLVDIEGNQYGLPSLLLGSGDLTGWNNFYNDNDDTYLKNDWTINQANFRTITTTAQVRARAKDWTDQAWQNSAYAAVLIDTWGQESTELAEYFTDEAYRRKADDTLWDSTNDLRTTEGSIHAQVIGGILRVPNVDYSIYKPANTRDYTGLTNNKNYYRRIIDVAGQVRNSCSLYISGFTLDDLVSNRIELWVLIPGKWASWCYAHTPELFNFGTFDGDNDPIRLASSTSSRIDVSFGTIGLDSSHTYFRLRLVIQDATIEPNSIVVGW